MKNRWLFFLILIGFTSNLGPSQAAGRVRTHDPAQAELKKLQGAWTVVETRTEGQVGRPGSPIEWVFRGNELLLRVRGRMVPRGLIVLDPSHKPKAIDVLIQGRPVSRGIYELKGSRLKLCWTANERPAAFDTHGNTTLEILERPKIGRVGNRRAAMRISKRAPQFAGMARP